MGRAGKIPGVGRLQRLVDAHLRRCNRRQRCEDSCIHRGRVGWRRKFSGEDSARGGDAEFLFDALIFGWFSAFANGEGSRSHMKHQSRSSPVAAPSAAPKMFTEASMKVGDRLRRLVWRSQTKTYRVWIGSTVVSLFAFKSFVVALGPSDTREFFYRLSGMPFECRGWVTLWRSRAFGGSKTVPLVVALQTRLAWPPMARMPTASTQRRTITPFTGEYLHGIIAWECTISTLTIRALLQAARERGGWPPD